MPLFNEDFVDHLPADPWEALQRIDERYREAIGPLRTIKEKFPAAAEAFILAQQYCAAYLPDVKVFNTALTAQDHNNALHQVEKAFSKARQAISVAKTENSIEALQARATALLSRVDAIEFTDGDLKRLQQLLNEMRELLQVTKELEPRHRDRVLAKLEKLQASLHKRMTNADLFWSLLPEYGRLAGEFGTNIKPLADRINEILRIIWRNEARQAQLPSDSAPDFLPGPDDADGISDPQ